jgi:uncharacterized protein with GYD domain
MGIVFLLPVTSSQKNLARPGASRGGGLSFAGLVGRGGHANGFVREAPCPNGKTMPYYAVLVNWTAEGIKAVKQSPQRGENFRKSVEQAGGKVLSYLNTMGAYDIVITLELPSDDVANKLALQAGMLGFARTTTLKGWSATEFAQLVKSL